MPLNPVNLGGSFILHSVRHARDAAGFAALNQAVTGEGHICERLLEHHPGTTYENYYAVTDRRRDEIISTSCFLPWQLVYEGVNLNAAMLEMVVTHPDYRHRGLIRAQIDHFHQIAFKENADLCIIQGIPYYYRQFGYTYVLDHMPFEFLSTGRIPQPRSRKPSPYILRPAVVGDDAALTSLYRAEMRRHSIFVKRDESYWRYLLQDTPYPVKVLENTRTGQVVGYVCVEGVGTQHVKIRESVIENDEQGLAILRLLQSSVDIRIVGSEQSSLASIAKRYGSQREQPGQWLVHIPSFARILSTIRPVLEQRFFRANQAPNSYELILNLYREAFKLEFDRGILHSIESLGFIDTSMGADGGDLWIPPDAFIRLLFGYRALDDLIDAWPDIVVKERSRHLWKILFPRMDSLILMPY